MKTRLYQFNRTKGDALLSPWQRPIMIIMLLWSTCASLALGQTKAWDRTFGGDNNEALTAVQLTRDGGYILGGSSFSGKSGDKTGANKGDCDAAFCTNDYWIVKLDGAGNKQWDKTFGGDKTDILTALLQTKDGGYILGGYSNSAQSGDKTADSRGSYDYWVVKLNAAGDIEWDKTLGGNEAEGFAALQQTSDGGYILGGYSSSRKNGDKSQDPKGHYDYWVVKLDAAGTKQWDKTYGGEADDKLSALQTTRDGGYILGGYAASDKGGDKSEDIRGSFDYWVVKLDADGNKQWDKTYGGDKTDILAAVQQTRDGGYILGGYSPSDDKGDKTESSQGSGDYWVVKLDAGGNRTWDKTLGGHDQEIFTALQLTNDGGYLLGGYSDSGITGNKTQATKGLADQWVVKLDANGNQDWDRTYGGSAFDGLAALQQAPDGTYLLAGWSESGVSGDKSQAGKGKTDYWVVKVSGNLLPPQLLSFSPIKGLPGTTVTIRGKNFQTTKAIRFKGLKAKMKVISDEVVTAIVPAEAITGKITIETEGGKVNWSPSFTVLQPELMAMVPFQGQVGTRVYLAGNRLSTAKEVYFNDVKSPKIKVYFENAIYAVVPEGATTGKVRVVLDGGGTDITKSDFTVVTSDDPILAALSLAREVTPAGAAGAREIDVPRLAAFPNPFDKQINFSFTVAQPQAVQVRVYDLLGREVRLLYQGEAQAKQAYLLEWRPEAHLPAGLYIIRLQAPGQDIQKKIMLAR